MLYIDNPVGTGFSFTDHEDGYPRTDEQVAEDLLEAILQFMRFYPYMIRDANPSATPFFAFGQSYGGAYVVSLSHLYLSHRENNQSYVQNIFLKGIGIGNGFISPIDQSLYVDYMSNIGYVTDLQKAKMQNLELEMIRALNQSDYSAALNHSQESLKYFITTIMENTNIYDFTFNEVCIYVEKYTKWIIYLLKMDVQFSKSISIIIPFYVLYRIT